MPVTALVVSPDPALANELAPLVAPKGILLSLASNADAARAELASGTIELVLVDVSDSEGMRFVAAVAESHPECAVVAVTPEAQAALGVQAARSGAADFVRRPFDSEELGYVIGKVLTGIEHEADAPPPSRVLAPETGMIGSAPAMQELFALLRRATNGTSTVLVRGESGSGKELVARKVHEWSPRRGGPFVKVHCGALPDNLLESELFGYEKGAFTGATSRKPGRVEVSEGGTLFLDEIGDITPAIQVKLLRLLQDRQFERLGSNQTLTADVRFVAATHRDLEGMVKRGEFREDLFYRLNVVSLRVPPLRERQADIEALALHFCDTTSELNGRTRAMLDADALEALRKEPWPGNVRQLQNFIERLIVLAENPRISKADVTAELLRQSGAFGLASASDLANEPIPESSITMLDAAVRGAEKRALEKALRRAQGNRSVAARLLGISRRALYYKLAEHEIE